MAIFELSQQGLSRILETTFAWQGLHERRDIQRLLREQVEIISPDTLVIAEEFGEWEDSRRRIDLLGIDKDANLVVIELKRTEDGGHMDLQAIRYAAMVSAITFEEATTIFGRYLASLGREDDAKERLLEFLEWDEPDDDRFGQDVRIVLASAEFSKEITTSVLWLNNHGLNLRCVRLRPYQYRDTLLLDVQQVIPLPEAEEYQVRIRDKAQRERAARGQSRDYTKYDVTLSDAILENLAKRRAIFSMIRYLCAQGVDPEEIRRLVPWKSNMMRNVPGTLDAATFKGELAKQLIAEGNKPLTDRYFSEDDELIYANGNTYAVTKMWGTRTAEAMEILVNAFGDKGVSYQESA